MKDKIERQRAIRRLISKKQVSSQEDLLSILSSEGITATQATLSRDLKEMKVVKMHKAEGGYFYSIPSDLMHVVPATDGTTTSSGIKSIEFSGQLAVIKTRPGYANMVAAVLDTGVSENIMGTIAGDDTMAMLLREGTDKEELLLKIESFLPGISEKLV